MSVLFAKKPSEHETVHDLHGALTNLAWIVRNEDSAVRLFNRLQRVLYSDVTYRESKKWLEREENDWAARQTGPDETTPDGDWAYHYFIASWMGRNGVAGTARVNYHIATRWTKGGGSGPLRFRSAVDSIPEWCQRLRNVHILRRDVFDALPKIEDDDGASIYCDPPYLPETMSGGSRYVHDFTPEQHAKLAKELARFKRARVVVSYYASPVLESLYPGWTFLDCARQQHLSVQSKRGMGRKEVPELLIVNGAEIGMDAEYEGSLFAWPS